MKLWKEGSGTEVLRGSDFREIHWLTSFLNLWIWGKFSGLGSGLNEGTHKRVKGIQAESQVLGVNNELHFRCIQFVMCLWDIKRFLIESWKMNLHFRINVGL